MKKLITFITIFSMVFAIPSFAQRNSADVIRSGLLGAGAGAIGGAASGAEGNDIWKGALTGAGVNILGGVLLDMIANGSAAEPAPQRKVYAQPQPKYYTQSTYAQPAAQNSLYAHPIEYRELYEKAYAAGYKAGYVDGYKDGME